MNILHIINYVGIGGTESYIYSLTEKLHNDKCKFFIAYSEEGPGTERFKGLGIETIEIKMKNPYDLKAAKNLASFCRENSIHVVHTHFLRENYISILSKLFGNKAILVNTRHMLIKNNKIVILANKLMTLFNYKIIAVSRAVENLLLQEFISRKKIQLIYTGVDYNNTLNSGKQPFRSEFNIDKEHIIITSVSRFSEEKGHEFFLESILAFKELLAKKSLAGFKFKIVLVGDGPLLEKMKLLSIRLGISEDIIFTGYRNDIDNILNDSDLYICHSQSEAFGISILEAMALNIPVISTDSGGTREIIGNNDDYGILTKYGDKKQLANKMLDLLNDKDLMGKYRKRGIKLILNKFSLDKTAIETYNIYSHNTKEK